MDDDPQCAASASSGQLQALGTLDAHYQSETLTGLDFLPVEEQKSCWVTDAYLALESPNGRWSLTGYVRNLSNTAVLTSLSCNR